MATVDVLINGYVRGHSEGDLVQPTISLVRTPEATIIVDPGILARPTDLVEALAGHGLAAGDVTHVFVTHHHIDHTRNIGMFGEAVVIDGGSVYKGALWADHAGDGFAVGEGVRVMATPGHAANCASLVVETAAGVVVLTHAWWFADMTPVVDPLAASQHDLEVSRGKILTVADIVIPGHGEPFVNQPR